jgi:hypothetical protein
MSISATKRCILGWYLLFVYVFNKGNVSDGVFDVTEF